MREIKFRAWDKLNKRMIIKPNDFGSYFMFDMFGFMRIDGVSDIPEVKIKNHHWHKDRNDSIIIMQYTGLKDKNGKEIYEGDIIKVFDRIDDEQGGYYLDDEPSIRKVEDFNYENGGITWFAKDSEVIGNIYENPELLKGGDE